MMMTVVLAVSAVVSYLMGGLNGAIVASRLFHHEDIREKGSGNPGFTNYKRVYGNGFVTWMVLIFDVVKTAVPVCLTAVQYASHILHIGHDVFFGPKEEYLQSDLARRFLAMEGGKTK